ncbi:DMT family transporter [Paenibacillus sp. OAS669]|uniref:DMT family transporter n=1 Tax=Paenibacillus sp. OAS669 TaxID=2663821 RepID=UPI00178969F0|nr:DMT family transporter [Paenibacillus sp. OAS669]MBE1442794.1 drug/metabolite transporter (DMT)-like permease [Paenibacillus sp. OAS669]
MKQLSPIRQTGLIAALVILWGVSFPINKMMLQYTPPLLFAGMRTLAGAILLMLLMLPKRKQIQWKQHKHVYILSSLLNVVLFFGLQTYGLKMMSSGLFSVLVYLQPVLVALFAWIWLGEHMSVLKGIGLTFGILGVAAISTRGEAGHISTIGVMLGIGTSISWALGTVYVKKVSSVVHFMWLAALQCLIGGIILIIAGSLAEPWSEIQWNPIFWSGLGFSSIFGVTGSWILYFTLVNSGEASVVTSYTFLVPIVSVLTGMLFLHESFTLYLLLGLIFIGISIGMVNLKPKSSPLKSGKRKILNKLD